MSLTFLVCLFVCLSQFLAAVCEGPDPLHLHVLCGRCGRDRSLGRGRQQDSGSTGPHDERILDGMQNYSHPPVCYSIVFNTHIMKYTCVCGPQAFGATFAAVIGAGMLVRSISYEHSPIPKHLAWMLHAGNNTNYIHLLYVSSRATYFIIH